MNIENLNILITHLKSQEYFDKYKVGFNMDSIFESTTEDRIDLTNNDCGTVACIAGHCNFIRSGFDSYLAVGLGTVNAGHWLGLHPDLSTPLFYPPETTIDEYETELDWNLILLEDVIELLEKIRDNKITKPEEIEDFYINIMESRV